MADDNDEVTFKKILEAAEQGDVASMNTLGECYELGTGVEKDEAKAVAWYRKAAELGFAGAQCSLGVCYFFGTGIKKDEAKAVAKVVAGTWKFGLQASSPESGYAYDIASEGSALVVTAKSNGTSKASSSSASGSV